MWTPGFAASIVLFAAAIALVALYERYRVVILAVGALIAVGVGLVSFSSLAPTSWAGTGSVIEWNSLGLIIGLFLFAGLFGVLGLPRWAALRLARALRGHPVWIFLALVALAFVLSMFLNTIAVVIILTPVCLEISRELGLDPIPLLLAEISSANLGGTSTLLGSPSNLIIGAQFGLTPEGFLEHAALPAVAALAVTVTWFVSRLPPTPSRPVRPLSEPPTLDPLRSSVAVASFAVMAVFLFEAQPWGIPLWEIGIVGGLVALAIAGVEFGARLARGVDWSTVGFLLFLFILVGALQQEGVIDSIAGGILSTGIVTPFAMGLLLIWVMAFASSVVDNIPLAAVAGPLIIGISGGSSLGPVPLAYASAVGLGVGANTTSIGSISNIGALSLAARDGVVLGFREYLRRALPITVVALAAASAVWLLVA